MTLNVWAVESTSVGSVRLPPADPGTLPEISQPLSELSDHDLAVLLEGIQLGRRLGSARAMARWVGEERAHGPSVDLPWLGPGERRRVLPSCGHLPHGPSDDPRAVVDEAGRVHGAEGIIVADASILPNPPRVNTNLPVIGAAEFIASTFG